MERVLKTHLGRKGFSTVDPVRSRTMSAIRGQGNKSTEGRVRMALVRRRVRGWVMHPSEVMGRPDVFFPQTKVAVFVDGCFWHGCPRCGHTPKTRRGFWKAKINRNKQRDRRVNRLLRFEGFVVIRIWEHALTAAHQTAIVVAKIAQAACGET